MLFQNPRQFASITRWRAFWTVVYVGGTAACNFIGIKTTREAGNRAGALALLNIAPLLTVDRLNLAADLLGVTLDSYSKFHATFGVMALVQGAVHFTLFIIRTPLRLEDKKHFYGLLVNIYTVVSNEPLKCLRY